MRRAVRVLSVLVGLAVATGGCRRGTLGGGPDAGSGSLPVGGGDAGAAGGAAGDAASASDLIVGGTADGAATDGFTIIPVPAGSCPGRPASGACPVDQPASGSACSVVGTTCEYGGADLGCRVRLGCAQDLTWHAQWPPCAAELADRCPVATPENGSPCDAPAVVCSYPAQTLCYCTSTASPHWSCSSADVDPSCPGSLPLVGARCDRAGGYCLYGKSCSSYAASCCDGSWVIGPLPCSE